MKPARGLTATRAVTTAAALVVAVVVAVASCVGVAEAAHSGAGAGVWESIPAPMQLNAHADSVQSAMDAESRNVEAADVMAEVHARDTSRVASAQAAAQLQYQRELQEQEQARAARFAQRHSDAASDEEEGGAEESSDASDEADAATEADPASLMQVKSAAEVAASAARRPRGIGHMALPRLDGTMTRVDYARKLWRERIRRRLRSGGMMRRYAPELFGQDIYGMDENDNVKIGSRATIWDAMNGPFAPMPKPSAMRPQPSAAAVKFQMLREAQKHRKLDDAQKIRHNEYYLKNDPTAAHFRYVPANHRDRNPFGLSKIFARARRDQALDVGPFDGPRFRHSYANPVNAFSKGAQKNRGLPLPSNPRLPWAEADASIAGMRPSKLQQFPEFTPPPKIPKFVAPPPEDKSDVPSVGQGDTPEF